MTTRKFTYLLELAMSIGIKTMGELLEYKKRKNLHTNEELIIALYSDKIAAQ